MSPRAETPGLQTCLTFFPRPHLQPCPPIWQLSPPKPTAQPCWTLKQELGRAVGPWQSSTCPASASGPRPGNTCSGGALPTPGLLSPPGLPLPCSPRLAQRCRGGGLLGGPHGDRQQRPSAPLVSTSLSSSPAAGPPGRVPLNPPSSTALTLTLL